MTGLCLIRRYVGSSIISDSLGDDLFATGIDLCWNAGPSRYVVTTWTSLHVPSNNSFIPDHGMLTLNRYILLDPLLLFFISGSVYVSVKFHNQRDREFSPGWWLWLSAVGVMLTCAISVKFVGLFVVILVGFRVIADLWEILGDLSRPVVSCSLFWTIRPPCRNLFKIPNE